ncbi:arabinose ABC transporter permease [Sulfolobus acidocaldarius SUSAZ]|nr:arabinose ABC transporter permease [Sulfolobus acidocaldarius SUSAZ]
MLAAIFVDIYDFLAISFVLPYIKSTFNPSPILLSVVAAGIQIGAVVGAAVGGWITDKLGRRTAFMLTISMMTILGIGQAFSPDIITLTILRVLIGFPLGMDFAVGFAYISEYLKRGRREVIGSSWQVYAGASEVAAILVVLAMTVGGLPHDLIWRVALGLGGVFSLIIAILRSRLPETAIWLIANGKFTQAKKLVKEVYGEDLLMLPDQDLEVEKPTLSKFLNVMSKDRIRLRGIISSWVQNFALSAEFYTFTFYVPIILQLLAVSNPVHVQLITLAIYVVAVISAFIGSYYLIPRVGLRKTTVYGFAFTFSSLLLAAFGVYARELILVAVAAAIMQWGHYWDSLAEPVVANIVTPTKYRGLASGTAYAFLKAAAVLSILAFPLVSTSIGLFGATLMSSMFALLGLISAIFIMPEVYNKVFQED